MGSPRVNFGDFITEVIVGWLGYELVNCQVQAPPRGEPILIAIGSILEPTLNEVATERTAVVWGSGIGKQLQGLQSLRQFDYRAVRGPMTAEALNLPKDITMGDPALLLPLALPFEQRTDSVVVVPHLWNSNTMTKYERLKESKATVLCSTWIKRTEFLCLLKTIVTARFVLAGSLHAAILAHAYGVPWAIYNPPADRLDKPLKWMDWLGYLGIETAFELQPFLKRSMVTNHEEGMAWWEHNSALIKPHDLKALITSFPFPIITPSVRAIVRAPGRIVPQKDRSS